MRGCAYQQRGSRSWRRSWWQAHGGATESSANAPAGVGQAITVRLVGGPAALIEIAGLRPLTDPALDVPGLIAGGRRSPAKTGSPRAAVNELGAIHAVLLSHDQHAGNPTTPTAASLRRRG